MNFFHGGHAFQQASDDVFLHSFFEKHPIDGGEGSVAVASAIYLVSSYGAPAGVVVDLNPGGVPLFPGMEADAFFHGEYDDPCLFRLVEEAVFLLLGGVFQAGEPGGWNFFLGHDFEDLFCWVEVLARYGHLLPIVEEFESELAGFWDFEERSLLAKTDEAGHALWAGKEVLLSCRGGFARFNGLEEFFPGEVVKLAALVVEFDGEGDALDFRPPLDVLWAAAERPEDSPLGFEEEVVNLLVGFWGLFQSPFPKFPALEGEPLFFAPGFEVLGDFCDSVAGPVGQQRGEVSEFEEVLAGGGRHPEEEPGFLVKSGGQL